MNKKKSSLPPLEEAAEVFQANEIDLDEDSYIKIGNWLIENKGVVFDDFNNLWPLVYLIAISQQINTYYDFLKKERELKLSFKGRWKKDLKEYDQLYYYENFTKSNIIKYCKKLEISMEDMALLGISILSNGNQNQNNSLNNYA